MARSTEEKAGSAPADAGDGKKRRRRAVLVPLLGIGMAAWAARRTLGGRRDLTDGWQTLPPAPVPPSAAVPDAPTVEFALAEVAAPRTATAPAPPVAMPPTAPAPAVPDAGDATVDAPHGPGSRRALDDGSSPDPAFTVKGKSATRIFHAPGGAYYTRARADVWFRTADDARAAGFTERVRRPS